MKIKNVTDERSTFIDKLMQAKSPHSKTDYFEINDTITFARSYDLTDKKTPFYFSFSQKNKLPVADETILAILHSDLVHQELFKQ